MSLPDSNVYFFKLWHVSDQGGSSIKGMLLRALDSTGDHIRASSQALEAVRHLLINPMSNEAQRLVAKLGRSMDKNARVRKSSTREL